MKVIIALGISAIGAHWYSADFFVLYSLINTALELYLSWTNLTDDKHTGKVQHQILFFNLKDKYDSLST